MVQTESSVFVANVDYSVYHKGSEKTKFVASQGKHVKVSKTRMKFRSRDLYEFA